MFKKIDQLLQGVTSACNAVGSAWIMVIMAIIVYDVGGRELFGHSLTGTAEIVSNSITSIAFLQAAYVLHKGRHVRTTMFYDKAGRTGKLVMDLLADLIGLVLFGLMFYSSLGMMLKSYAMSEYEGGGTFRLISWPFRGIIVLGSALMVLQYISLIAKLFIKRDNGDAAGIKGEV